MKRTTVLNGVLILCVIGILFCLFIVVGLVGEFVGQDLTFQSQNNLFIASIIGTLTWGLVGTFISSIKY